MKYKVNIPYIDNDGKYIGVGIYDESDIDLGVARYKSIITAETSDVEARVEPQPDFIKTFEPKINDPTAVKELKMDPEKKILKVKHLKINSASLQDISDVKYVSKKIAQKVIDLREEAKFSNYLDLDERVPLGFNRKWEDIVAIDFEYIPTTINNHSYSIDRI